MRFDNLFHFARLALALFVMVLAAFGQTVTGTLEGHVKDPTGALIPGAKVTVTNDETGLVRTAEANSTGYYQVTFLPVGPYTVTVEMAGMGMLRRAALVDLNSTRTLDFEMRPASVATEVTVTDEVPLIEISRGEVKNNIEQQVIEDRPLSSRNMLSLVEMLPGFQASGGYSGINNPTLSSGSYVSFNGTGSRSATFQIDGVNNDDSSEGSSRQNVNISSIKDFQVLTNSYSAEFGRAGGAVVIVQTKSGTNRFHGDLYEFLQNEKLNANSFYGNASGKRADGTLVSPRAPYRRNQFGYTIGGPIFKNKLFLYHSFEQTRLIQYNTFTRWIFLPSDKLQIGECRTCINPADHPNAQADLKFLQSILDRFPRVQPNNPNLCDHCLTETKQASYPDQDYSGKLDWNATKRDTLAIRYQYSRQKRFPYPLIQGETAFQNNRQQNVGVTQTHMFNASTWGEFRFGLGLRTTLVDIASGNDTPIVRISNPSAYTTTTMGSAGQFPINRYQTDYQFVYNLSHVRGRHVMRAGVDIRRQHLDDLADNYSRGWWTFGATGIRGQPTFFEGWENFMRGYYTSFEKGYGNFTTYNRLGEFNQYVMDDIKVTSNFTLNLGFRYEVVLAPSERDGKVRYGFDTFTRGYEPRFGFAWSPSVARDTLLGRITGGPGRMSVRGGFGLFHNRLFQSIFSQGGASLRSQPPYGVYRSFNASFNVADPTNGFFYDPASYNPGRISLGAVDPGLRMPQIQQLHFTIDRQLPGKVALSVGYNHTHGVGLLQNQYNNRARFPFLSPVDGVLYDKIDPDLGNTNPAPGYISIAQPRTNQRRPDARYSSVIYISNGAWSQYNAMRVSVNKRYSGGLHWAIAYTWAKTVDTGSDVTAGSPISENGAAINNRGLSDFDRRHHLNLNYGWLLPFYKNPRGLRGAMFYGWTMSGNMTMASGSPFTVTSGLDSNADGLANDRPLLLNPQYYGASVDNGRRNESGQIISTTQLPLDAFFPTVRTPSTQRPFDPGRALTGSVGRNVFHGQGLFKVDFGFYKSFRITEGHKLTFRAEMYGATNTPHFGLPSRSTNSLAFGQITSTFNPFNYVGASQSDASARIVQLALRYTF